MLGGVSCPLDGGNKIHKHPWPPPFLMPLCMSELEGIEMERGGGLHWSQDQTKPSRPVLLCHPPLPSLSLSVPLIQMIQEYRHFHAVPAGGWRVVNREGAGKLLLFLL